MLDQANTIVQRAFDGKAKERFMRARRGARMKEFMARMRPEPGTRILDLGGAPGIWQHVEVPLRITILNLDASMLVPIAGMRHEVSFVEGDACAVRGYRRGEFDIVFSNSVIEHVGPEEKQEAFAREVRGLGRRYWVQTPSRWFPIEAHNGMPFWWFYPESVRRHFIAKWKSPLPEWTQMVEGTRVLSLGHFRSLFPEGNLYLEFAYGIPKSYTMYRS
jgi:hypothetical protein